uniref:LRAT domain-containing protein n=1 Tax=Nelumbo nucifera TaxID=4432 RepID=A0A822YGG4_NELNU|nr:TPA_asm: hypothetical protein HUJ06_031553 [Nelumbo nucifera]
METEKIKPGMRSIKRLFVNKIDRCELKKGDHIYCWRSPLYIYAHHGIYIGDEQVIHFFTSDRNSSYFSGSSWDGSSILRNPCTKCDYSSREGVVKCCLDCFLSGGELRRFHYNVSRAFLLTRIRAGTCSHAKSSPPALILQRAKFLLECNGFGRYDVFNNNCEHFAIYCSTGLIARKPREIGQVGALNGVLQQLFLNEKLKAFLRKNLQIKVLEPIIAILKNLLEAEDQRTRDVLGSKLEEIVEELGLFGKDKQNLGSNVVTLLKLFGSTAINMRDALPIWLKLVLEVFISLAFYLCYRSLPIGYWSSQGCSFS